MTFIVNVRSQAIYHCLPFLPNDACSEEKTLTINLDRNDITEILLKVALNTIQQTNKTIILIGFWNCYIVAVKIDS
jgi:hypothetical protein